MRTGLDYAFSPEKRALDLTIATASTPLALVSRVWLGHLLSEQPGEDADWLFRQERLGANGIPFRINKLRTLSSETGEPLGQIAQLFRRYGVDELPQAYHILRGDMSVVAHRPIPQREKEEVFDNSPVKLVDRWKRVVEPTRPGWFSTFTIYNHGETDKITKMIQRGPMKLEWDIKDVMDGSLSYDIAIIASALKAASRGET